MLADIYKISRIVTEKANALWRDLGASSLALVGFAAVPVVAFVGVSGDSAIGYLVKSRLTEAIDAGGLAAARQVDLDGQTADLEMFFRANFPDGYLGATIDGPYLTPSADGFELEITATAAVPTSFMRVVGIDTMTVSARTVIARARSGMELVLVMDNTGSMCCDGVLDSKIETMKAAAHSLVDIMFGSNQQIENFWVGLVPYTAMVNVGDATLNRHLWLTNYTPSEFDPASWLGCVEARPFPFDMTDAPFTDQTWEQAVYANHYDNYWGDREEVVIAHLRRELGYTAGTTLPTDVATLEDLIEEYLVAQLNPESGDDYYDDDEQLWTHVARLVLGMDADHSIWKWNENEIEDLESYLDPHDYGGSLPSDLEERSVLLMEALVPTGLRRPCRRRRLAPTHHPRRLCGGQRRHRPQSRLRSCDHAADRQSVDHRGGH